MNNRPLRRNFLQTVGIGGVVSFWDWFDNSEDDASDNSEETEQESQITPATGSWQTYQSDSSNTGEISKISLPQDPETTWQYETNAEQISSPVVADSTVYAWDSSGTVFSLAATTGEENWTVTSVGETTIPDIPLLDDGVLYVSGGEGVSAINASDGSEVWETDITGSSPKIMDTTLYINGSDVVAINTSDGSVAWKNEDIFSVRNQPPAVSKDYVFVSSTETLYALDRESGDIEWEYSGGWTDDISGLTAPSIHGSTVYFAAQVGVPEKIYGVDIETGKEVFSDLIGDRRTVPVGSISFRDNNIVALEESGTVFSRPMESPAGWAIDLGIEADASAPPIVVGDDVVVTTSEGTHAFDSTGESKWSHGTGNYHQPPTSVNEWVFVCDGNGTLYALH